MKIVLVIAGALLVAVAGLLAWLGAFGKIEIREQDFGPYSFVYVQETTADLAKVRQLTQELGARLEAASFPNRRPAQIYYPTGRGIQNQIGFMVERTVPFELLGADTFFRPIPPQRYMAARFPFRNPLSYVVGQFRVEPAMEAYRKERKYAESHALVILQGDHILYLQPVSAGE